MLQWFSKNKSLLIFIAVAFFTLFIYFWAVNQPFFAVFIEWAKQNFWLYFTILTTIKIIAIVWPPIPGGLLTIGSIPVIGWFPAYMADMIGSLIGASIAYFLGKKYGWDFLQKLFDDDTLEKLRKVKIVKHREVEAIAILRVVYGAVSEVISYGSGLLGVSYRNFLTGIAGWAFVQLPLFYVFNNLFVGQGVILNGLIVISALILFSKLKGRYFE